ncbi:acyl-CoA dehydrogenase family protein [Rhodococcus sp. HM1]|uniref:acyl-CoA dehydrogenase family protein n=1 Tax=unclassified Rhodococcus (in: high G+C Gram-positive bacteria) TaxID=192944 RepID=UPI0018CF4FAB|nr:MULTISPECIES: acyl-CoA dehydrogenase family protein [unclassified Rhodococcus (in: high G+C Gram-positive bacteria)]MBH0120863.1 acyl-CoA dehydrogenase family protein [Rhodococcus sp. CX]MCK8670091.1 acyl-CoA dehydrogenase family protein [Rhodococcus sp. HM1]
MNARLEYDSEHRQFREVARDFVRDRITPVHEDWERASRLDRSLFTDAGKLGLLGFSVDEKYGGPGVDDFRYNAILIDEVNRAGNAAAGIAFSLQNDVVLPYLTDMTDDEQKARWLPGVVTGETVLGIAMTEPGAGSDLTGIRTTAVRDGDHYVVDGAKTFISNGQNGDLFVVATRTSPDPHNGLTLLVVEADTPGFSRGRNLEKIGLHAQDTSELTFTGMRVPVANRLGEEGQGFHQLVHNLPQERLSLSIGAVAAAEGVFAQTVEYVKERKAFGKPVAGFQNTRFVLAELATELDLARTFLEDCIAEHVAGELSAARAARLKWWTTELQVRVADRCLQLHGGYGYMREYAVSRAFVDARIQTIYGGTTEIMKTIVAKDLGI